VFGVLLNLSDPLKIGEIVFLEEEWDYFEVYPV